MRIIVRQTDVDGYFLGDVAVDDTNIPANHYDVPSPNGFAKAKINDTKDGWVEGATTTELMEYEQQSISERKLALRMDIRNISDEKDAQAELIIAGGEVSLRKQNRYRRRVPSALIILDINATAEAKEKATQKLQMLALGDSKTVEVYAQDVVNTAEVWNDALDIFSSLIDTFENRANALVELERFSEVEELILLSDTIGKDPSGAILSPPEVLSLASTQVANILTAYTI